MQNSIYTAINAAVNEIQKVIIGKQDVIRKVMMSILANGHILLDYVPGVGKMIEIGRASCRERV